MCDCIVSGVLPIVLDRIMFFGTNDEKGVTATRFRSNAVASIKVTSDGIVLIITVTITDAKHFPRSTIRKSAIKRLTIAIVVVAARRVMLADTIAKLLFQNVRAIRVVEVERLFVTVSAIITTVRVGRAVTTIITTLCCVEFRITDTVPNKERFVGIAYGINIVV